MLQMALRRVCFSTTPFPSPLSVLPASPKPRVLQNRLLILRALKRNVACDKIQLTYHHLLRLYPDFAGVSIQDFNYFLSLVASNVILNSYPNSQKLIHVSDLYATLKKTAGVSPNAESFKLLIQIHASNGVISRVDELVSEANNLGVTLPLDWLLEWKMYAYASSNSIPEATHCLNEYRTQLPDVDLQPAFDKLLRGYAFAKNEEKLLQTFQELLEFVARRDSSSSSADNTTPTTSKIPSSFSPSLYVPLLKFYAEKGDLPTVLKYYDEYRNSPNFYSTPQESRYAMKLYVLECYWINGQYDLAAQQMIAYLRTDTFMTRKGYTLAMKLAAYHKFPLKLIVDRIFSEVVSRPVLVPKEFYEFFVYALMKSLSIETDRKNHSQGQPFPHTILLEKLETKYERSKNGPRLSTIHSALLKSYCYQGNTEAVDDVMRLLETKVTTYKYPVRLVRNIILAPFNHPDLRESVYEGKEERPINYNLELCRKVCAKSLQYLQRFIPDYDNLEPWQRDMEMKMVVNRMMTMFASLGMPRSVEKLRGICMKLGVSFDEELVSSVEEKLSNHPLLKGSKNSAEMTR
ncbi:hypothetical protein HK098_003789 [Nowakowskiella sp. JEL0407]|nr:hypothetical protein HK098_003789 [Nowakowskiella sp. JEL0407]